MLLLYLGNRRQRGKKLNNWRNLAYYIGLRGRLGMMQTRKHQDWDYIFQKDIECKLTLRLLLSMYPLDIFLQELCSLAYYTSVLGDRYFLLTSPLLDSMCQWGTVVAYLH